MIAIGLATLITVAAIIGAGFVTWTLTAIAFRGRYSDGYQDGKAAALTARLDEGRALQLAAQTVMLPAPVSNGRHAGPDNRDMIDRWLDGEDLRGPVPEVPRPSYAQLAPWPDGLDATITDWAAGMVADIRKWNEDT